MQILISTREIIRKYGISYARINCLTKKGIFRVVKRVGNKRLYSHEEIGRKIAERK